MPGGWSTRLRGWSDRAGRLVDEASRLVGYVRRPIDEAFGQARCSCAPEMMVERDEQPPVGPDVQDLTTVDGRGNALPYFRE